MSFSLSSGLLNWPQATFAASVDLQTEPNRLVVTRETDAGMNMRDHVDYIFLCFLDLSYSILFSSSSILFYSILFYSLLFYSLLFSSLLFYLILLHSILLHSILMHSILFYSIIFDSILFYSILYCLSIINDAAGSETISTTLPAVISADLRLNTPRFAKIQNIMKARKMPVETITVETLGVDISPRLQVCLHSFLPFFLPFSLRTHRVPSFMILVVFFCLFISFLRFPNARFVLTCRLCL
jgi:hypothetical protein